MERGKRKELIGVVVSDKMDKTRVVAIESGRFTALQETAQINPESDGT